MESILIPKMYVKNIFSIPYDTLKERGITYLLFDVDNTILDMDKKEVNRKTKKWLKELKEKGFFIILFSNATPWRLKPLEKELQLPTFSFSCKPLKRNYKKMMRKYHVKPTNIAAIGDQIYTDIKGANQMGIFSILIEPLGKKDSFFSICNRLKEKKLWKKWEKEKRLKKGEYYE